MLLNNEDSNNEMCYTVQVASQAEKIILNGFSFWNRINVFPLACLKKKGKFFTMIMLKIWIISEKKVWFKSNISVKH